MTGKWPVFRNGAFSHMVRTARADIHARDIFTLHDGVFSCAFVGRKKQNGEIGDRMGYFARPAGRNSSGRLWQTLRSIYGRFTMFVTSVKVRADHTGRF
jgi:hypothetical protein